MNFLTNWLNFLEQSQSLTAVIVGILGLCVGSFLNVVIHRIPLIMQQESRKYSAEYWCDQTTLAQTHKDGLREYIKGETVISLSFPPSACPNCQHRIRWFENIPIISWLFLRGACSSCATPISIRYPLVELITMVLSVVTILTLGATVQGLTALIFVWILIALTAIDFDTQYLPDRLVFPLGILGLSFNSFGLFVSPIAAIWGAVLGFCLLWGITVFWALVFKKQGMGHGDFKLLAAIGAWLGVGMLPLMILLSSLLGAIIGGILFLRHGESRPFAFGPYIAMAGIVALFWGEPIISWYLSFYAH